MKSAAPFAVVFALVVASAEARTWTVGGRDANYPFISPAIAAATDGDVIRVRKGVYREDLLVNKRLTLVGENEPTLFGTGVGSVVTIVAPACELRGFVIEGSGTGQTNEMDAAIQVLSSGNRIVGNRIRRTFYGVVVVNARGNEVRDNEIRGFGQLPFGQRGDGIYLYRAPDNTVAGNRIIGERDAIYFQYAPRGRVIDNVVSDSRYGLHDMFSDDAVIVGNEFSNAAVGANIMNSRRIRFERNRIRQNRGVPGVGVALKDCDDSIVAQNSVVANARGLLLDGSSANRIADNTFRANDTAVTLFSSAERNQFGGNEFVDNWSDLVLSGRDSGTTWTIDGRGNYWTRYRGFDFDGDGVGESPHQALGAFERLEGANPAARIFLQSPAAVGLELAASVSGRTPADAIDEKPLVKPPQAATGSGRVREGIGVVLAALSFVMWVSRRPSCSRSVV